MNFHWHLIHKLYGRATEPNTLCGSLDKPLLTCEKLPVLEKFEAIAGDFPDYDVNIVNNLSTDQIYLPEMVRAVSSREC